MPYRNKQMLRDANGDLIPQYWDVVEQEFKPLTGSGGANDVRLTGSIVERNIMIDAKEISLAGGEVSSSSENPQYEMKYDFREYVFFYVVVRASDYHKFSIKFRSRPLAPLSLGNTATDWQEIIKVSSGFRGHSDYIQLKGDMIEFQIKNEDTDNHMYNIYIYGVK